MVTKSQIKQEKPEPKVIFIDWGYFIFRAIYSDAKNHKGTENLCLSMLIADIQKVGLNEEDVVIIAVDSPGGSWRKELDTAYKANRKEQRSKFDIDWEMQFENSKALLMALDENTPFNVVLGVKLEADDIIAYGVRKFSDQKCVIISSDSDFEQLARFKNVRLFSPLTKRYKQVKNPEQILLKKIAKERTDNLISPLLTERDYKDRETLVNLIKLPDDVEKQIDSLLDWFPKKSWSINNLPCQDLHGRWHYIYSKNKQVSEFKVLKKKSKPKIDKQIYLT